MQILLNDTASANPWSGEKASGSQRILDVAQEAFPVASSLVWVEWEGDFTPSPTEHYYKDGEVLAHVRPAPSEDELTFENTIPTTEL